jgi:hypothetical protein
MHIFITEPLQCRLGSFRQRFDDLDRVNLRHEFGQNRRLVTRAGPNFQNAVIRFQTQLLRHERYDVWLRNSLTITNRQRAVFITGSSRFRGDKFFPWHFRHCSKYTVVVDSARHQLLLNHLLALGCEIGRWRRLLAATARHDRRKHQPLPNSSHKKI